MTIYLMDHLEKLYKITIWNLLIIKIAKVSTFQQNNQIYVFKIFLTAKIKFFDDYYKQFITFKKINLEFKNFLKPIYCTFWLYCKFITLNWLFSYVTLKKNWDSSQLCLLNDMQQKNNERQKRHAAESKIKFVRIAAFRHTPLSGLLNISRRRE